jgi:hypothetical protein
MAVNVLLVAFNLLPAFPMDGGRVLRALLAMRMDYARATQLAATVGQGMALVFVAVGLFINPFLLFIALFVWIGATQEAAFTQVRSALAGIPLQRVMVTDFRTLMTGDSLERAVELLLAGPVLVERPPHFAAQQVHADQVRERHPEDHQVAEVQHVRRVMTEPRNTNTRNSSLVGQ